MNLKLQSDTVKGPAEQRRMCVNTNSPVRQSHPWLKKSPPKSKQPQKDLGRPVYLNGAIVSLGEA